MKKNVFSITGYLLKIALSLLFFSFFILVSAKEAKPIKILFIGNSYTYAGGTETDPGVPRCLKEFGAFYGKDIQYDFIVKGGALLERQYKETKAVEMIQNNHYDYVVLQDQSSITLRRVDLFREYCAKFNDVIKKSGAKTIMYMTWGYANRPQMGDTVAYEYNRIAKDLNAMIAPCGVAWKYYFEKNPGSELHISDKSHPNGAGVYLNACVFYHLLFDKIPSNKVFVSKNMGGEKGLRTSKKLMVAANAAFPRNLDYGKDQRLNHNPYFQSPTADINQIIMYGQSLSTGQQTAPSISVKNYAGNLMLGEQAWSNMGNSLDTVGLTFKPLYSRPDVNSRKTNADVIADVKIDANNQINCESPVIGFVNAVKHDFDQYFPGHKELKFAATSSGEGGRTIEVLSKNCPNKGGKLYKHFLTMLTKSKEAADRMKKTINCSALLWMQGEYNYGQSKQGWEPQSVATKDKAEYKKYLSQLITDMTADVEKTYQQTQAPIFITYQVGAQFTRDFDVPVGMAQLETGNTDPRVVLAAPIYPVCDRGGHLCPNGSRWFGEMMAKVYFKTVIKGEKWKPLQPKGITKGGDYLDIDFIVPQAPLRLDTMTLAKAKNYGFEVKDSGEVKPIRSVQLISGTKVRLSFNSKLKAGNVEVNYAGPSTIGNGNLCDSDDFQSFTTYQDLIAEGTTDAEKTRFRPKYEPRDAKGNIIYGQHYPMQNFSCAFYYQLPANQNSLNIFPEKMVRPRVVKVAQ